MAELLRPPTHRGPLIAAGAVLLTVGILLVEFRLEERLDVGWRLAICAAAALMFLAIAMQWPTEGGHPTASQSILLVAGLVLLFVGLLHLADVLGAAEDPGAGAFTWMLLVLGAVATAGAVRKLSGACALIAAVAFGGALIAAWEWIFDMETATPMRWLLLFLAIVYAVVSVALRGGWPRHSTQLVNAAGIATFMIVGMLIGAFFIGPFVESEPDTLLPGFWELVVLVAGCGLIAYAAADREPGPAYLGVANLAGFVLAITTFSEDTLEWWPFTLLVLGFVVFAAGLRPRRPLPPEPDAYPAGRAPLAARADSETVVNVRHR